MAPKPHRIAIRNLPTTGLTFASQGFRKIGGHQEIPLLIKALEKKKQELPAQKGLAANVT